MALYVGAGDLTLGLQAGTASTLSTEPSSLAVSFIFVISPMVHKKGGHQMSIKITRSSTDAESSWQPPGTPGTWRLLDISNWPGVVSVIRWTEHRLGQVNP